MKKHFIPVTKTARYFTLGEPGPEIEEVWFVTHGYGQLASYFIRNFECLNNGKRLIVAPEALQRFYVSRNPSRVGASWMTSMDREHDIADYLGYLSQVSTTILNQLDQTPVVRVLGFSQGANTATRWVTEGELPAQQLILWAGPVPHDTDLVKYGPVLSAMSTLFVVGDEDYYMNPERLATECSRLEEHDVAYTFIPFEGKHKIYPDLLKQIADTPLI